ncbi:MAG TPA: hypothetical protein VH915_04575, partial [Pedococcus sp.]
KTDKVTFHRNGVPVTVKPQAAISTFDDAYPNKYWTADNPWSSTKTAGSGVKIRVLKQRGDTMSLSVTWGP